MFVSVWSPVSTQRPRLQSLGPGVRAVMVSAAPTSQALSTGEAQGLCTSRRRKAESVYREAPGGALVVNSAGSSCVLWAPSLPVAAGYRPARRAARLPHAGSAPLGPPRSLPDHRAQACFQGPKGGTVDKPGLILWPVDQSSSLARVRLRGALADCQWCPETCRSLVSPGSAAEMLAFHCPAADGNRSSRRF